MHRDWHSILLRLAVILAALLVVLASFALLSIVDITQGDNGYYRATVGYRSYLGTSCALYHPCSLWIGKFSHSRGRAGPAKSGSFSDGAAAWEAYAGPMDEHIFPFSAGATRPHEG
jgi:hypothetical protein